MTHFETRQQIRGEYRAVLTGPNGEIKHDSGWKPNTICLNGLRYFVEENPSSRMGLGTSNVPATITQTGLQGTYIDNTSGSDYGQGYLGSPTYGRWAQKAYTFGVDQGVGTVGEFALTHLVNNEPAFTTTAGVRVALDTPIVKGAQDSLTIYYKFYVYVDPSDHVGVIDISGVSYDYVLRPIGINSIYRCTMAQLIRLLGEGSASGGRAGTGTLDPIEWTTGTPAIGVGVTAPFDSSAGAPTTYSYGYGGTTDEYYADTEMIWDIDDGNTDAGWMDKIVHYQVYYMGDYNYRSYAGIQFSLKQTADGVTPFRKLNTHELRLNWRCITTRYVP